MTPEQRPLMFPTRAHSAYHTPLLEQYSIHPCLLNNTTLRHATKALRPAATEAPVKVLGGICAQTVPAIGTDALSFLLGLGDLVLQLRGTRVDELELRQLGVEDANDLCKLWRVSVLAL
jgi:hypothetical protein